MHLLLAAFFSLAQALSYPQPLAMTASHDGHNIAYVLDERGVRSLWFASAPDFAPHKLWDSGSDDGQELTNLNISNDGKYVVYVRGGSHDANWPERPWPDPNLSPVEPHLAVMSIPSAGGTPKMLADGDAPVISPDSTTVAFLHDPDNSVWTAPIDGAKTASRLFFDRVSDGDLAYSPDGKALAFTSDRGDHSFIGIYRDQNTPIQFLAPTTNRDAGPVWSPDGSQIAFLRLPGAGGPPQDLLTQHPQIWSIWVADVRSGRAHQAWHSGSKLRDSFPGINGPQLHWLAANKLMFVSEQTNWPNLYEVSAAGSNQIARDMTPGSFMVEDTAVTSDGSTVYYTANAGSTPGDIDRRHVFSVAASGGAPKPVTSG
ncbi:MAG TPA: DPP IV N-terminal domain-containing protein, partial [Candidatus Baltobacteraceae bacterium]|nr:DPP IV N-terminal domain-containing protein [Candidatus Baltobacteraceae bacterium]